ncbi:DNA methyltransferase Dim-2 [Paecilomyces variotii No. 5]|uniref:DNA (cytosine-5-)-methyltransferase n=1 Tax=Byssochlamys spectabilis (strain No. 5 / NBRC 109023) TaxID=1356009 RepID=V5FCR6_BYSSN|nr:DNA methyltransferase Dim-2 [Paecilomyces variotii No. 5]
MFCLSSIKAAVDRLKGTTEMLTPVQTAKDGETSVASMGPPVLRQEPFLHETPEISTQDSMIEEAVGDYSEDSLHVSENGNSRYEMLKGIKLPPSTFPLSQYEGWEPPLPVVEEADALNTLLKNSLVKRESYGEDEFVSVDLHQFTIYRDSNPVNGDEMVALHEVALKQGNTKFFFDGILNTKENQQVFLRRVPFEFVSVGGYEMVEQHTVGSDIWIQSIHGKRQGSIWYRVCEPSQEYKPYHDAFRWLADFGKHFLDFLSEREQVSLNDFRNDFAAWLKQVHGHDTSFKSWLCEFGKSDFRQAVVSYSEYLLKQAIDIDGEYENFVLWQEIGLTQPIIAEQPQKAKGTVVTPYVYRCFRDMEWGGQLHVSQPAPAVLIDQQVRIRELGFETFRPDFRFKPYEDGISSTSIPHSGLEIRPGDVVSVERDEETVWKSSSDNDLWYAFVQGIRQHKNGTSWLDVIWLYCPGDTVCANMTYPHLDELFMSDHCNCGDRKIRDTEVVGKVDVRFFSSMAREGSQFFVRQTYCTDDETFLALREDDFYCSHRKKSSHLSESCREMYHPGDTVLVHTGDKLEPVEIISCSDMKLRVRQLLRRKEDFDEPDRDRNELVYTDRFRTVYVGHVERRCHIRFYSEYERENGLIPPPYCRQGNGDSFYITSREMSAEGTSFLQAFDDLSSPISLTQGFDPKVPVVQLRGLNIFSGGGSFDRGLEEGGAVRNEWAVEWGKEAMLTYRANLRHSGAKLFWGSVDDFLGQSLNGTESNVVARVGEVDFVSAGSPCQGYALTNNFKQNITSLRNCSMVASVAAFIDHFRPRYAVLENVTAMAKKREQSPFSQMLCALVGMGYQARILNLDAWSFGAPQSRSRLFIFVAAPGLKLPDHPALTHSHPPQFKNNSLGQAANGLPFGSRRFEIPVFDFVTAAESTRDLPRLLTAKYVTTPDPDMRPALKPNFSNQTLIELVPKAPWAQGLQSSVSRGWMARPQTEAFLRRNRAWGSKEANSYGRVHPKGLIPTIVTRPTPACAFTGKIVHWEEDRVLTVKEARRAQGVPDDEILIGSVAKQWKIIGNSVARQVALSLGMTLRDACLQNERIKTGSIARTTAGSNAITPDEPTGSTVECKDSVGNCDDIRKPKKQKARRIIHSETSTEETTCSVTATLTDRFLGSNEMTPSIFSDSSSAMMNSKSGNKRVLESSNERLCQVTTSTTRSHKRRRTSRLVILDSDDEQ